MIHPRNKRFAAGTAMTEFVLAVPFLVTVVAFIFFFGWAMMHKQQVIMASRYVAWETIYGAAPDEGRVNDVAMAGKGQNIVLAQDDPAIDTKDRLLNRVSQGSEELAKELFDQATAARPGTLSRLSTDFLSHRTAWAGFSPTISSHHARDGTEWSIDEVRCWNVLGSLYLSDLDGLKPVSDGYPASAGMVSMIQNLYVGYWGRGQ